MKRGLRLTRPLALTIGALAVLLATPALSIEQHGAVAVTCTNPVSNANWQIKIDWDHSTVDSHPASIGATEISWHTADGENYKLDRTTGNLTVTVASSTGGYFLYDRCKLDN
jgi:hypothetical protein